MIWSHIACHWMCARRYLSSTYLDVTQASKKLYCPALSGHSYYAPFYQRNIRQKICVCTFWSVELIYLRKKNVSALSYYYHFLWTFNKYDVSQSVTILVSMEIECSTYLAGCYCLIRYSATYSNKNTTRYGYTSHVTESTQDILPVTILFTVVKSSI